MITTIPRWLTQLRFSALIAHCALIASLMALIMSLASKPLGGVVFCLLATFPLLLALPGLLQAKIYTGSWASLVAVFYGPILLAEAYMHPHQRPILVAIACLGVVDFALLMLWVKAAKKHKPV